MKRKPNIIDIILIIIIIVLLILIVRNKIGNSKVKEYKTVDSVAELGDPIQEEYDDEIEYKALNYEYDLHLIYTYKISGRVVKTRRYLPTSVFSAISPLDVGMVWGEYVKDDLVKDLRFKNYGDRLLYTVFKDPYFLQNHPDYETHMSHNHLIPSSKEVKQKMNQIKKDDLIEITGYLVDVETKKYKVDFKIPTSTKRTDSGKGACETIYVTDIKWLIEE